MRNSMLPLLLLLLAALGTSFNLFNANPQPAALPAPKRQLLMPKREPAATSLTNTAQGATLVSVTLSSTMSMSVDTSSATIAGQSYVSLTTSSTSAGSAAATASATGGAAPMDGNKAQLAFVVGAAGMILAL